MHFFQSMKSLSSAISDASIPESILAEELEAEEDEEAEVKLKDLQEESSKGKVSGSLFLRYMLAGGNWCTVLFVLLLYIVTQAAASGVDFFVSFWVNIEEFRNVSTPSDGVVVERAEVWTKEFCIYIYSSLIVALFFVALVRSMLFYKLAIWSSQKLHDTIFHNVIGATMRFFDTNPSGRILNRFSKDIGGIDELLPKVILDAGQILLTMVGSLVLVTVVNPYFLILVAIVGVFFLILRHIFLKTSKNVKRLEGISKLTINQINSSNSMIILVRSPVFTHLNATLQGLTTIRAYGAESVLKDEFDKHQDSHTSAWFMYIAASSAFGFYLDILCFIFVGLITFSFLLLGDRK